jgi:hypothetical protein
MAWGYVVYILLDKTDSILMFHSWIFTNKKLSMILCLFNHLRLKVVGSYSLFVIGKQLRSCRDLLLNSFDYFLFGKILTAFGIFFGRIPPKEKAKEIFMQMCNFFTSKCAICFNSIGPYSCISITSRMPLRIARPMCFFLNPPF